MSWMLYSITTNWTVSGGEQVVCGCLDLINRSSRSCLAPAKYQVPFQQVICQLTHWAPDATGTLGTRGGGGQSPATFVTLTVPLREITNWYQPHKSADRAFKATVIQSLVGAKRAKHGAQKDSHLSVIMQSLICKRNVCSSILLCFCPQIQPLLSTNSSPNKSWTVHNAFAWLGLMSTLTCCVYFEPLENKSADLREIKYVLFPWVTLRCHLKIAIMILATHFMSMSGPSSLSGKDHLSRPEGAGDSDVL